MGPRQVHVGGGGGGAGAGNPPRHLPGCPLCSEQKPLILRENALDRMPGPDALSSLPENFKSINMMAILLNFHYS